MSAMDAARRYVAAWNGRDAAGLAVAFCPGGTYEDPNTNGPIGTGPLGSYAGGLWAAFPDLWFEEVSWQRVVGYFDRAALMEQLGVMSVVQPHVAGPVHFGVCTQVRSRSQAPPGAVSLTMIEARSDQEVQRIREIVVGSGRAARDAGVPLVSGGVVGRPLTTVTVWEIPEAARQVMHEANHRQVSADMLRGELGSAFHASTWNLARLGELRIRCPECGRVRDGGAVPACDCGAPAGERPAYW